MQNLRKFDNFISNLNVLEKAENEDLNNEFVISGIIDKFFIQFEPSWKVLKELLRYEGKSAANFGIAQRNIEGCVFCI